MTTRTTFRVNNKSCSNITYSSLHCLLLPVLGLYRIQCSLISPRNTPGLGSSSSTLHQETYLVWVPPVLLFTKKYPWFGSLQYCSSPRNMPGLGPSSSTLYQEICLVWVPPVMLFTKKHAWFGSPQFYSSPRNTPSLGSSSTALH